MVGIRQGGGECEVDGRVPCGAFRGDHRISDMMVGFTRLSASHGLCGGKNTACHTKKANKTPKKNERNITADLSSSTKYLPRRSQDKHPCTNACVTPSNTYILRG